MLGIAYASGTPIVSHTALHPASRFSSFPKNAVKPVIACRASFSLSLRLYSAERAWTMVEDGDEEEEGRSVDNQRLYI